MHGSNPTMFQHPGPWWETASSIPAGQGLNNVQLWVWTGRQEGEGSRSRSIFNSKEREGEWRAFSTALGREAILIRNCLDVRLLWPFGCSRHKAMCQEVLVLWSLTPWYFLFLLLLCFLHFLLQSSLVKEMGFGSRYYSLHFLWLIPSLLRIRQVFPPPLEYTMVCDFLKILC